MKIMVVDDDAFIQALFKKMLEEEGYEVNEFSNMEDAFGELKDNHAAYSLLITDIVMPQKTGIDFMEEVKRHKIEIPILAISAGVENAVNDYMHYADLFADKSLPKPVEKAELIAAVEELTGGKREQAAG